MDLVSRKTIRLLRDKGFDKYLATNENKSDVLIWAAEKDHEHIVQALLNEGASLKSPNGEDVRLIAAAFGSCRVLELLHALNLDMSTTDESGWNAIHYASSFGRCDAIRLLIDFGVDHRAQTDGSPWCTFPGIRTADRELINRIFNVEPKRTPIHTAVIFGQLDAMKLLLELKSDMTERTACVEASLKLAVHCRRPTIMPSPVKFNWDEGLAFVGAVVRNEVDSLQVLLQHVNIQDNRGLLGDWIPGAVRQGSVEAIRLLEEHLTLQDLVPNFQRFTLLHAAIMNDCSAVVQFLIGCGYDIEARNDHNLTPLLLSIDRRSRASAQVLIERGADLRAKDDNGSGPLHLAISYGDEKVVRLLIKHGADVEAQTANDGLTPLIMAADLGYPEIVGMLLESGAPVNSKDRRSWSALHHAAYRGWRGVVEELLSHGADPTSEADGGIRPLTLASNKGHRSIEDLLADETHINRTSPAQLPTFLVRAAGSGNLAELTRLLMEGVDINATDPNGQTALSKAAENGRTSTIDFLIQKGAHLDSKDTSGESPLWWAAWYGHLQVLELLLGSGVLLDRADRDGCTPLCVASLRGRIDIVASLLKNGSDPDFATSYGMTPLLFAVREGHIDVAKLLLQAGANIDHATPDGATAFSLAEARDPEVVSSARLERYAERLPYAAWDGRIPELFRLLRTRIDINGTNGNVPLIFAATSAQDDVIRMLLKNGANVHTRNEEGKSAMHLAAAYGHTSTMMLLYEEGAKIECTDTKGRRPLHEACYSGHQLAAQLLLDWGAKIEVRTKKFSTPLYLAVLQQRRDLVELLVEAGADFNAAGSLGIPPLCRAVIAGDLPIAALLLVKGATLAPEPGRNRSPLCYAARRGFEDLIELLVNHGDDPNYVARDSSTPVLLAAKHGHAMAVELLIEKGADVNVTDDQGRTPLSYAKENDHELMVKILSQAATIRLANESTLRRRGQQGLKQRQLYKYLPLPKSGNYVRILELQPGKVSDIISFSLYAMRLEDSSPFEALSYEWKEKTGTVPVECHRERLLITPNCMAALKRIRSKTEVKTLWIDAICINQQDDAERSEQVAMMARIFSRAKMVLMWIGEEEESTEAALTQISKLHDLGIPLSDTRVGDPFYLSDTLEKREDIQALVKQVTADSTALEGLTDLLLRPYFTRAWIFQEILLAGNRGVVMCGKQICQWDALSTGLRVFQGLILDLPRSEVFHSISEATNLFMAGSISFADMLDAMPAFAARDPRDIIFAGLSLLAIDEVKTEIPCPIADYTLTVQKMYMHTARYVTSLYWGRMRVPWNGNHRLTRKTVLGLPSWTPDYGDYSPRLWELNPDHSPLWGYRGFLKSNADTTPISLYVDGCVFDRVSLVLSVTVGTDVYHLFKCVVEFLAKFGRSIYDPYFGNNHWEDIPRKERKSTGIFNSAQQYIGKRYMIRSRIKTYGIGRRRAIKNHYKRRGSRPGQNTNFHAFLATIFNSSLTPVKPDGDIAAYFAWKLSVDNNELPGFAKRPPANFQGRINGWRNASRRRPDYDFEVCHKIERNVTDGDHQYDLVLTENGYMGIANCNTTEKGMLIAVIGGSEELVTLRQSVEGWYELVDRIQLNHLGRFPRCLQDLCGAGKVERWKGWK
ncbi:ankyrin repeat-containing domain protein [Xylaria arbuscula]|nr:ankyrin repeat-containing domain protein [Xylaria arbuscula]